MHIYPLNVSKTFYNEHQRLLVVAHSSEEENHFRHIIVVLACAIRMFKVVRIAGPQEWQQLFRIILGG